MDRIGFDTGSISVRRFIMGRHLAAVIGFGIALNAIALAQRSLGVLPRGGVPTAGIEVA